MTNGNNQRSGKLFVVSAPSGAGKTTVVEEAIKRLKDKFDISKVTTYTTRPPRQDEKDNKDYHFISYDEFEKKFKEGFFLETTEYNGHKYGSPASLPDDLKLGKSFIIVTDIAGVKNSSKLFDNATYIWLTVPSIKELKQRLVSRGSLSDKQINQRLKLAEEEMKEAQKPRLFDYQIINEIFEQTVEELILIIKKELTK